MDAAASPFPREETTPPVTKMYLTGRLLSWLAIAVGSPPWSAGPDAGRHQRLDPSEIGGCVHADGFKGRWQYLDSNPVLERAKLLQPFERLEPRWRHRRKL